MYLPYLHGDLNGVLLIALQQEPYSAGLATEAVIGIVVAIILILLIIIAIIVGVVLYLKKSGGAQ